ncbi:MAG: phosphatase PAP2 family protein [Clostridiales bacterium]|nr:phosphatase PAP2 family protein [Clostridiales bacterium]
MLTGLDQLEFRILDWIADTFQSGWIDSLAPMVSFLADGGWFWILLAVALLFWKPGRKVGLTMALALILSFLVCNVTLKPLVGRARPFDLNPSVRLLIPKPADYSFPSGHTQSSFAAATAIYRNKRLPGAAALALAALIGLSRLYLYVHFVTDVLAGALIGYLLGCLADTLINEMRYRHNAKKRKKTRTAPNRAKR